MKFYILYTNNPYPMSLDADWILLIYIYIYIKFKYLFTDIHSFRVCVIITDRICSVFIFKTKLI